MSPTKHNDKTAKNPIAPDFLEELGISPEEQERMENDAYSGAAEDIADNAGLSGNAIDSLESNPATDTPTSSGDQQESDRIPFKEEDDSEKDPRGRFERLRGRFSNLSRRAKVGIGGGILTGGIGISTFFGFGSFQAIHLMQTLTPDFTPGEESSDIRTNGLLRYARSGGNVGETRVSFLGSKKFASAKAELARVGVTFNSNEIFGVNKGLVIDADKFPVTKGLPRGKIPGALESYFNRERVRVKASNIQIEGNKVLIGGVAGERLSIAARRADVNDSISQLDGGKISKWMKARAIKKYYNLPSFFHPFRAVDAKITEGIEKKYTARQQEKARKAGKEYKSPNRDTAYRNLQEKTSGFRAVAGGTLLLTAASCMARDAADDAITFNREAVVVPSALQAGDAIAIGAQQMAGQDFRPEQLDAFNKLMSDDDGKTIWQAAPMQAKRNPTGAKGEELPDKYAQAFSSAGGAAALKHAGGKVGSLACNPAGQAFQIAAGGILLALSLPSGGTTAVAYGSLKLVGGAAASAGVMIGLKELITSSLENEPIPEDISAPVKGGILAYGSRELANITERGSGGVELSAEESDMLDQQVAQRGQSEFQSKSLFAKIFDAKDYRSVAGRAVDSIGSPKYGLQNMAKSLLNIGPTLASAASNLTPSAQAADVYDYGFNRYGIPQRLLNNGNYDDPYENADRVSTLLDGGEGDEYIDRAKKCFGVTISKDSSMWGVTPENEVNPNSEEYENANCADESNPNWDRTILFVSDTLNMEAAACFTGEKESCEILGAETPEEEEAGVSLDVKIGTFNIFHIDNTQSRQYWENRLRRSVNVITDPSNDLDVVGLQEARQGQQDALMTADFLKGSNDGKADYGIYPKNTSGSNFSPNPVIFKSDKYEVVEEGSEKFDIEYDGQTRDVAVQVKLREINCSDSCAEFYVINTHDPAGVRGGNDSIRNKNSRDYVTRIRELSRENLPIFLTGDFNSPYTDEAHCIISGSGVIKDAWEIYKNMSQCADGRSVGTPIDRIYASPGAKVSRYWSERKGETNGNGSDRHDTVMAKISYEAENQGITSEPYTNPVYGENAPDPSVIEGEDGKYHVYATGGTPEHPFVHLTSPDMVHWTKDQNGVDFEGGTPDGLRVANSRWAPDIAKTGSFYTLTFSQGTPGSMNIGYATSDKAGGPFKYRGVLVPSGNSTIDSHIYVDGGRTYLLYGSGYIDIVELDVGSSGTINRKEATKKRLLNNHTGEHTIEGAYIKKEGSWYYLYYSSGDTNSRSGPNEYKLRVARSRSVDGRYDPLGAPILQGKDPFRGPGHNSVLTDKRGKDWAVYHAWKGSYRSLMLDPITYKNGWPVINNGNGPSNSKRDGPSVPGDDNAGSVRMGDDYATGCERLRANGGSGLACDGQCVDFVKFRLKKHIAIGKFASLGNGHVVAANLGLVYGYRVNNTPAVNSVVSWRAGQFGMNDTYGHTAMVSKVNNDGSIVVEEYNVVGGSYSTRKIPASQASQLTYAHTEVDF